MRDTSFSSLPAAARGFTLLEVLVAVVVLAIGILGLVGLQTSSLKQNQNAMARTVAVEYANSIMDKMRGNPKAAARGMYNIKSNGTRQADGGSYTDPTDANTVARAREDVKLWHENLKKALPGGKVQICRVSDDALAAGAPVCGTEGDYALVCILWEQGTQAGADPLFEKGTQQFSLVGRI
jgi:type IV pilus assembly protein PilV